MMNKFWNGKVGDGMVKVIREWDESVRMTNDRMKEVIEMKVTKQMANERMKE